MIRLDSTLRKLQVILAGVITANQLPVTVCYSDKTATTYNGGTTVINTNSVTVVDICAAPAASTVRDIDGITVQNADTAAATITIRYNDNATLYTLFKVTLAVGDQLTYTHGQGWKVVDSSGAIKSLSSDTVTLAGAQTLTNKSFNLANNTLTGTLAQFNTALSDGDFVTIAGTQTLTDKTLTSPTINGTVATTGLTLPALTLSGAVGSTGNPSLNIGTGALTAGIGMFSGSVGVGVSPTIPDVGDLIEVGFNGTGIWGRNVVEAYYTNNIKRDGAVFKYASDNLASAYMQYAGTHVWYDAVTGLTNNVATIVARMSLSAASGLAVTGKITASAGGSTFVDTDGSYAAIFRRNGADPAILLDRTGAGAGSGYIAVSSSGFYTSVNLSVTGAISASTTIRPGGYTVGTLPAGTVGMKAYVTDALAPANLVLLAAGGAAYSGAQYTGAQWVGD